MNGNLAPSIVVRSGVPSPTVIPIPQGTNVLGRHADADIVLNSPFISRQHVRIDYDGRECTVRDLGSKNGTYLNNRRIDERPVPLGDRDLIHLGGEGGVVLEFQASTRTPTLGQAEEREHPRGAAVTVDARARQVRVRGQILDPPLSRKEFDILDFLFRNADRACTPLEIAAAGWPERAADQVSDTEIRQYIRRIRRRIEFDSRRPQYIRTIHGYGYRLGI